MTDHLSQKVWNILACPYCRGSLSKTEHGAQCRECHRKFPLSNKSQLDLRLKRRKAYKLDFEVGIDWQKEIDFGFEPLQKNSSPQVDFTKIKIPWHLSKELMSYFPKARSEDSLMLDLGCGKAAHKTVCQTAGFEYVGLDFNSPAAEILGDGHALPFKDHSFEFVLSMAVLEHIQYPFIAMKEIYRVIKPEGKFIGTVAFLEPFHGNSFYHHTHLGIFNSLNFAGFHVKTVAPRKGWPVMMNLLKIGVLPKLPLFMAKVMLLPLHWLHLMWWKMGYMITHLDTATEAQRILKNCDEFSFVAEKRQK